ncbi:hypothetical protein D3C86_2254690 [compost metagenome]
MDPPALRCGDDDLGPAVLLALGAFDQAAVFEVVHEADHLAGVEAEEVGQLALRGFQSAAGEGQHGK